MEKSSRLRFGTLLAKRGDIFRHRSSNSLICYFSFVLLFAYVDEFPLPVNEIDLTLVLCDIVQELLNTNLGFVYKV